MHTYPLTLWQRLVSGILIGLLLILGIGSARAQPSAARLAPALRAASRPAAPGQTYRVRVQDPAGFARWLTSQMPAARTRQPTSDPRTLLVSLGPAAPQTLLTCPLVTFVDVANRRAREESQLDQSDLSVNHIEAVHRRYPALAGQGLVVAIKENLFDQEDIDFTGRIVASPLAAGVLSAHATAMATYAVGGGNTAPSGKGVAWRAGLASADFAELLPDDGATLQQLGVTVQNHSYGVGIENYYGLESQAYDAQTHQYPTLLHVFSAGNSGDQASPDGPYADLPGFANLTGQFKMAKNTLCVGGTNATGQVDARSSRGPAYDGRLKPELVAFGADGTSDAAALVSGISLLLQQAYREQHAGALPSSALVKAALLNSANPTGAAGPDYATGYGQADALGAVETLRQNHYFLGEVAATEAEQAFRLTVRPGTPQLKVTLVWTDPAAEPGAGQALRNDLDLELVHLATGQRWQPWVLSAHPDSLAYPARRAADHRNNVEQITLDLPPAGDYVVRVRGYAVPEGPQPFALAYEQEEAGFEWLAPGPGSRLRPATDKLLRWRWAGPAATARLEYKLVGSNEWQLITAGADLTQELYTWTVPDQPGAVQVRCLRAGTVAVSDTLRISAPTTPRVGYACADEAQLYWPAVPGAARYQLYRLGETQLLPLAQITDTTWQLNRRQYPGVHYAVAPIVQGGIGERGSTINITDQGTACYVRTFLARELVADTVRLDLTLGSLYRLRSATLERETEAGYQPVQTISPVSQLQLAFFDAAPTPGLNRYRVRLDDASGRQFYSETEGLHYTQPDELALYPNPVPAGQPVQVLVSTSDELHVWLYDRQGRLVLETELSGVIKTLPTSPLKAGLYLLRGRTAEGQVLTRRVVVE